MTRMVNICTKNSLSDLMENARGKGKSRPLPNASPVKLINPELGRDVPIAPDNFDAIVFDDNTGIGIASFKEGPPWSEETLDPQWEACVVYFTFNLEEA